MSPTDKITAFESYMNVFNIINEEQLPIGVYSGGPNEQGYSNISANTNTHNNGNHLPYWEGVNEDWYDHSVHYNHFPYAYNGGNLIYDINNYIYNGIPSATVENWMQKIKEQSQNITF